MRSALRWRCGCVVLVQVGAGGGFERRRPEFGEFGLLSRPATFISRLSSPATSISLSMNCFFFRPICGLRQLGGDQFGELLAWMSDRPVFLRP